MNGTTNRTYAWGAAILLATTSTAFALGRKTAPAGMDRALEDIGMEGMDMPGQAARAGDTGMAGMGDTGGGTDPSGMAGMEMGGDIRLTFDEIGTFGITFGTADVRPLVKVIRAVGFVEFDETRMAFVSPKFGGWVERLHVDFTGQAVREGDPLLDVYSPELVSAQEDLLLAARMATSVEGSAVAGVEDGARDLLASARRRLRYWDIAEDQIDRLLETGEVRKTLTLFAPVAGVVMEKNVFQGQSFGAGANLYMIADLSSVWVNAEVFESDASLAREGMRADVTVAALPGRWFPGRIEYVYPTLEDRTRSLRARVSIDNPEGDLKPGMYATVRLVSDLGTVLTVPTAAVLHSGERAIAFMDMGGGTLMPSELVLGIRGDDEVQVLGGLDAGQRVVTSAQFLLDSESNLAEVMRAMMAQMNISDVGGMDMDMGGMDMGPGAAMDMGDTQPLAMPDTVGGR